MSGFPQNRSETLSRAADGSVLIVVLVVCLGLVSLALLFGHSMLLAYRGSDDDLAGRQASHAMEGAARYAEYLMTNVTNDGDLPDFTTYQSEAVPVGEAFFWFIGVPLPSDPPQVPVYRLVDEASKLNLNRASAAMLENLPGMTDDLAEAIVNWRSAGGSAAALASGAGAGISATSVKEAPFESVEELAQVDGGTDLATLYGNDTNLNHVLDAWEDIPGAQTTPAPTGNSQSGAPPAGNGQVSPGLLEYLTAFSREPRMRRDGTQRFNVTSTSESSAAVTTTTAGRTTTGTTVTNSLTASRGLRALVLGMFTGGRGQQILTAVYQRGVAPKSVLEFAVRGGMTAAELGQITPYLTMTSNTFNVGLVNVNTASQTVLSCVPGITYQLAGQLVAARSQLSAPSSDLSWVIPILGTTPSIEAGPYLTTRSYQVMADVAATGRNGHGYRRTQFVIDSSIGSPPTTPQIVYRRDVGGMGWALGANARQTVLGSGVTQ